MHPTVLIIEPRREVAAALEEVITSANYSAMVRPYVDRLQDLALVPAAIIVRISFETVSEPPHAAIARLPTNRPPVIAIAWEDDEVAEAERLNCDVVLRAPHDIGRLCDVLRQLIKLEQARPVLVRQPAVVPIGFDASRPLVESQ